MLRVAPIRNLNEGFRASHCRFCAASFENVVQVVSIALVILPTDLGAPIPHSTRVFTIKVKPMALRNHCKWPFDGCFKNVSDDLAETMRWGLRQKSTLHPKPALAQRDAMLSILPFHVPIPRSLELPTLEPRSDRKFP